MPIAYPLHIVFTDLILSSENIKIEFFASIIAKNILYGMIKKEVSIYSKLKANNNQASKSFTQIINDQPPFLKAQSEMKYSIVLDLDETLIHFFYVYIMVIPRHLLEEHSSLGLTLWTSSLK